MASRNCPGTILPARPLGRRPQRPCPWSNAWANSILPLPTSPTENWGQSRLPKRDCFDENCGLEIDSDPTSLQYGPGACRLFSRDDAPVGRAGPFYGEGVRSYALSILAFQRSI